MKYLKLPTELTSPLTTYVNQVFENPNRFITYTSNSNIININDSAIPGISDEFIKKHNLNISYSNNINLNTGRYNYYYDIAYPPMSVSLTIIEYLEHELQKRIIRPSGHFFYPKNGYMGWHTNGNVPGTRVYLAYSQIEQGSYFKYVNRTTNEIITSWDEPGWTVRVFDVVDEPSKYLWHCVYAPNAPRISFGYLFE